MAQRICPLFLSFLVGITALLPFSAWTEDYKRTVITDPGLSVAANY
jgi:hypothetical protein